MKLPLTFVSLNYENEINTASNDPTKVWNILKQTLPSKKSCTKSCSISPQEFNDFFSTWRKAYFQLW